MRDEWLIDPGKPEPPSWTCGDETIKRKLSGILFRSEAHKGGRNVVVFTEDAVSGTYTLKVHDPHGEIALANLPDVT